MSKIDICKPPLLMASKDIRATIILKSASSFRRWRKANDFPNPDLKIGSQSYWMADTVCHWLEQRMTSRAGREKLRLVMGIQEVPPEDSAAVASANG